MCLLFSFVHPAHEQLIRDALRDALPDVHVSLSSDVLPEFREYERFATTTADAYLGPGLAAYLRSLGERLGAAGLPQPVVMQSSGGVADLEVAAGLASTCVLSGPAGGVVGAAFVAEQSGFSELLTFDMGGTSTDVSVVLGGEVQTTTGSVVAGIPIKHPMVDVHTVSAGGGSVAWIDSGGALRVGPMSAGAEPGPGVLRARRQRGHCHRCRSRARLSARRADPGRRARAEPPARRAGAARACARSLASTRSTRPPASSRSPKPRWFARCA